MSSQPPEGFLDDAWRAAIDQAVARGVDQALAARDRAERRRWLAAGVLLAVVVGVSGPVRAAQEAGPRVITASELRIVDPTGVVRATLNASEDGASLDFPDGNGGSIVSISAVSREAGGSLYIKNGGLHDGNIQLGVHAGQPVLVMNSSAEFSGDSLLLAVDKEAFMTLGRSGRSARLSPTQLKFDIPAGAK